MGLFLVHAEGRFGANYTLLCSVGQGPSSPHDGPVIVRLDRAIQYSRALMRAETLWNTGYSAFAEYDGSQLTRPKGSKSGPFSGPPARDKLICNA
jgi:hypothetical protein